MSSPTPVGRKPSVSIAEEQPKDASAARTTVPAAASSRISPKDAEKQLLASIPDKEREIVKGWKVKQVVITKLDNGTTSSSSVQGMNLGPNAAAGRMLVTKTQVYRRASSSRHRVAFTFAP